MYLYEPSINWFNLRVVHVEPVHDDVQAQVFGAVHIPLFWQGETQIAKTTDKDECETISMSEFRNDKISTYVSDILIQCIVMYMYKFQYQYKYHRSDKLGRKLLKETKRSYFP